MGLQRPHDGASTTARLDRNDRTIGPQRPLDWAATTSQCKSNDRTMLQTLRKGLGIPGKSRTFVGNENNLIRL